MHIGIHKESQVGRIIVFAVITQLNLIAVIRYIDDTGIRIVTGVGMLLTDSQIFQFVVIEHHTITHRKPPLRQGIGELQIDIMVEDIPAPVRILLPGHQVITLNTQHHRQPFGQQRRIQLSDKQWQFVG